MSSANYASFKRQPIRIKKKKFKIKNTEYEFEKYIANKNTLKETIEKYGVAIIPGVLNDEECSQIVSGMWDYFEYISKEWTIPINRNNKNSWKQIYKLYPKHSMLHQHFNCGHAQCVWDVRQNPKIVDIFAHFWKCKKEDLLVSFDGFSCHFPPENIKRGWFRNLWYHTDQSFMRNDFECIQSWITGLDVDDNDATLAFYEKSNNFHGDFQKQFEKTDKSNWYKLEKNEEQFYIDKGCQEKKIKCPKGSLVVWDSRTIHCGVEANKKRKTPKFRSIIYLCYQPRQQAMRKNILKKQKAFNELRMTSHWPCKVMLFPKNPRTYGGPIPEITMIDPPVLNSLGKKLAGF